MNQEEQLPEPPKLPHKRPKRRVREVDLSKIGQKMQMILEREINLIFDESGVGAISAESHRKFLNYLKFLPELREQENEDLDNLSDEEIESLLNKKPKKGEKT